MYAIRSYYVGFILLAGGEPLLRKDVIKTATDYKNILFPVFTNGTMIDDEYLDLFDKFRNIVPVISIEGDESNTDTRRGKGIYQTVMKAMEDFQRKGILYGASITITIV